MPLLYIFDSEKQKNQQNWVYFAKSLEEKGIESAELVPDKKLLRKNKLNEDVSEIKSDNPEYFLTRPLVFSLRHVRILNDLLLKNKIDTTKRIKYEKLFRDMVNYLLTLGQTEKNHLPDRILPEIRYHKTLYSLLSGKQQRQINLRKQKGFDALRAEINKSNKLTAESATKIMKWYKVLRREAIDVDANENALFKAARTKVISWMNNRLKETDPKHQSADKAGMNAAQKKKRNLSTAERIGILEIHRIMRKSKEWTHPKNKKYWDSLAKKSAQDILLSLQTPNKTDPTQILAMELLDDMLGIEKNNQHGGYAKTTKHDKKALDSDPLFNEFRGMDRSNLRKMVRRVRATHFVAHIQGVKGAQILTPMELRALREILTEEEYENNEITRDKKEMIENIIKKETEELEQAEKDKTKSEKEFITKVHNEVEPLISGIAPLTTEHTELINIYTNLGTNTDKQIEKDAEKAKKIVEKTKTNGINIPNENEIEKKLKEIKKITEKIEKLKEKRKDAKEKAEEEVKSVPFENLKKDAQEIHSFYALQLRQRFRNGHLQAPDMEVLMEASTSERAGINNSIIKDKVSDAGFVRDMIVRKDEQELENLMPPKGIPTNELNIEQVAKLWNEIDDKQIEIDEEKAQIRPDRMKIARLETEKTNLAKKIKKIEKYLYKKQGTYKHLFTEDELKEVKNFRTELETILKSQLTGISFTIDANKTEAENFAVWQAQIQDKIGIREVSKQLRSLGTPIELKEMFQGEQNAMEIMKGGLWHFRDLIQEQLEGAIPGTHERKEAFFAYYHEQNKEIYGNNRLSALQNQINKANEQKANLEVELDTEKQEFLARLEALHGRNAEQTMREELDLEKLIAHIEATFTDPNTKAHFNAYPRTTRIRIAINHICVDLEGLHNRGEVLDYLRNDLNSLWKTGSQYQSTAEGFEDRRSKLTDRILLERTHDVMALKVKYGQSAHIETINGQETEVFFPGEHEILRISQKTMPQRKQIDEDFLIIKKKLQELQTLIKRKNRNDEPDERVHEEELEAVKSEFKALWRQTLSRTYENLSAMRENCRGILPEAYWDSYFWQENGTGTTGIIQQYITPTGNGTFGGAFAQQANLFESELANIGSADGDEIIFDTIPKLLADFSRFYDFESGHLAKATFQGRDDMKRLHGGLTNMQRMGFYSDTTEDKSAEFKEKFEEERTNFVKNYEEFKKHSNAYMKILEKDLEDLRPTQDELTYERVDKFQKKYGVPYIKGEELLRQHHKRQGEMQESWDYYANPTLFDNFMALYNGEADPHRTSKDQREEAVQRMSHWETVAKSAERCAMVSVKIREFFEQNREWTAENTGIKKWANGVYEKTGWDPLKYFGRAAEVRTHSFADMFRLVKESFEATKKIWKRKSDKAVGDMGLMIFGEKGFSGQIGKEFKRMSEDSESARVEDYKKTYGDYDGWDLLDLLYITDDADEARALIDLTIDKGYLRWDDPKLWFTLSRLQPDIKFFYPEDLQLDMSTLYGKLDKACTLIWTHTVFARWKKSWDGKWADQMGQYTAEFKEYEQTPEKRDEFMNGTIKKWMNGSTEVTPAKYEQFIHMAFEGGKMNGQPDRRWWYIMVGLGLRNGQGQTILPRTVLGRIEDKHLARMPQVNFFSDSSSWKKDGFVVPPGTPGAEQRAWNMRDYEIWASYLTNGGKDLNWNEGSAKQRMRDFYYKNIVRSDTVKWRFERMDRAMSDNQDHDDQPGNTAFVNSKLINILMQKDTSGKAKMSTDSYRNLYDGIDLFLEEKVEEIRKKDAEYGNADFWQTEKEKLLREIGSTIQSLQLGMQVMKGNYNLSGKATMVLTQKEFYDNKLTLPNASFDFSDYRLSLLTEKILDKNANISNTEKEQYMEALQSENNSQTTNFQKIENTKEFQKIEGRVKEVLAEGENSVFGNTDAIWSSISSYVDNKSERSAETYYQNKANRIRGGQTDEDYVGYHSKAAA